MVSLKDNKNRNRGRKLSIAIRKSAIEDLDGIVALENSSFGPDAWDAESLKTCLENSLHSPDGTTFMVAFNQAASGSESKIVGYVLGTLDDGAGEVIGLAVDQNYRGQKLGQTLFNLLCDKFQQAGAKTVVLQVQADNAPAIHLYDVAGFVKTDVLPAYYPTGADAILMTRFYQP